MKKVSVDFTDPLQKYTNAWQESQVCNVIAADPYMGGGKQKWTKDNSFFQSYRTNA